ncbi:MAG: hypothetical protein R2830_06765 [Saprospiraceae bacterium]
MIDKIVFSLLLCLPLLIGCKTDNNSSSKEAGAGGSSNQAGIAPATIKFICQPAEEPNADTGAPQNEVFVKMGDSRVKVADILACESITKDLYEQYQIPANAIDAAGGWWAGAGDYFYVIEENGNYVVKQGQMFEEQEDNSYNYKAILTFSKDGKQVF